MALVHGVSDSAEQASGGSVSRGTHHLVTIDPTFAANEPKVTGCSGRSCVTLPKQPANFVYLRTGPGGSYHCRVTRYCTQTAAMAPRQQRLG